MVKKMSILGENPVVPVDIRGDFSKKG